MVDRALTSPHPPTAPRSATPADAAVLEQQVANLQRALGNSRLIGAATGILMVRHGWTYEQAFRSLREISQTSNRKVVDLADEILLTGTLDELPDPEGSDPGGSDGGSGAHPV